jgi:hypothetical protein
MKRIIIIILVVGLIAGVATWKYVFRKAETSVASKKVDITISANDLLNAYETNEDSANAKFLNKILQVEGTVAEVKSDTSGYSIYLKEPESVSGVLCGFNKEVKIDKQFKAGDVVIIKGICNGYLMDVVLNKCSFE